METETSSSMETQDTVVLATGALAVWCTWICAQFLTPSEDLVDQKYKRHSGAPPPRREESVETSGGGARDGARSRDACLHRLAH